jgi:membrane protease YdiL (CAAX protease family)
MDKKRFLILSAWTLMLLVSDLPDILWKTFEGRIPEPLFWAKVGLLSICLALCFFWKRARPLRPYVFVLFVFFLALGVSTWVGKMSWWISRFGGPKFSFMTGYLEFYLRDTGVALAVIAALWILKRRRREFFLVKGDLGAPIEPVRWLGIRKGESWRQFGWIFAFVAGLSVLIPTLLSLHLSKGALSRAALLLPAVLVFAAVNAFNEEVYYRSSFLTTLKDVLGKNHTLMISSVFFGMAHYLYGSPPGVIGFLMTGFLAWLMGKSMLETKGFFWAWFIHFVPDVVIFASYAINWVRG